jgi:hypothetical protein
LVLWMLGEPGYRVIGIVFGEGEGSLRLDLTPDETNKKRRIENLFPEARISAMAD